MLFRFLKETQPEAWQVLEDHYSAQAEAEVLKRLEKALKDNPTHVVLREGIRKKKRFRFPRLLSHSITGTGPTSPAKTFCGSNRSTGTLWMMT